MTHHSIHLITPHGSDSTVDLRFLTRPSRTTGAHNKGLVPWSLAFQFTPRPTSDLRGNPTRGSWARVDSSQLRQRQLRYDSRRRRGPATKAMPKVRIFSPFANDFQSYGICMLLQAV